MIRFSARKVLGYACQSKLPTKLLLKSIRILEALTLLLFLIMIHNSPTYSKKNKASTLIGKFNILDQFNCPAVYSKRKRHPKSKQRLKAQLDSQARYGSRWTPTGDVTLADVTCCGSEGMSINILLPPSINIRHLFIYLRMVRVDCVVFNCLIIS